MSNLVIDPLGDGKSRVELLGYMGGDLDVVNDAKASFERVAESMGEREVKLLRRLLRDRHSSPLRGTVFKFKVKAPLAIARQWFKHLIASNHNDEQLGWNEKSFRYTEIIDPEEFYIPRRFRRQSSFNKQVSQGDLSAEENEMATLILSEQCRQSYQAYKSLIELGVGREQARYALVPAVYTSWVWTVSLQALLHFIDLRNGSGAQDEITRYAQSLTELVEDIIPETIKAWNDAST